MILAKKIRLKPTEEQELQFWKSANTARFVYNWTLSKQEEQYKDNNKFLFDGILRKEITVLKKKELSWLNEVSNDVTKQAVKDACSAYKRFFNSLANKPKFKSKKKSKPSFYNDTSKLKVKKNSVLLTKIGWVRTAEQVPINCKYKNPRISFDGKYWYLSIGIEQEQEQIELTEEIIGVHVGVRYLSVCSNGMRSENINKTAKVRKIEKRLCKLQRNVSRKYEKNKVGNTFIKTNNIVKQERRIRLLYRRLTNIRTNHLHQETSRIVKSKPSTIVMQQLDIKSMMKNRYLAKVIAEQKIYEFRRQMKYKCKKYGITFVEVSRYYPITKTCSNCGHVKEQFSLHLKTYKCEKCSLKIDKDFNASLNLRNYNITT